MLCFTLLANMLRNVKKAELPKATSFGSSDILYEDPPLSVPPSRAVWLSRKFLLLVCFYYGWR